MGVPSIVSTGIAMSSARRLISIPKSSISARNASSAASCARKVMVLVISLGYATGVMIGVAISFRSPLYQGLHPQILRPLRLQDHTHILLVRIRIHHTLIGHL